MNSNERITDRFRESYRTLVFLKKVKNQRQFALALGEHPQSINWILNNRGKVKRYVTIELLEKVCLIYGVRAEFLLLGTGPVLK